MESKERIRKQLRVIIFGTHTPAGRLFDILLILVILLSVTLIFLESVSEINVLYGHWLKIAEWTITILFTIEYITRIWISENWRRYAFGFFGIVDLLAILPTFISLIIPGSQALTVIRAFRLTRLFRILNLFEYVDEARILLLALIASRRRIMVFTLAVLAMVTVFGAVMYVVEAPHAGFTSIPRSIYWAIVTLTTVGYGDIAPQTTLGQAIASMIMILGYAIIAIPTGILGAEMLRHIKTGKERICTRCGQLEHPDRAKYCHTCGDVLPIDLKERSVL